VQLQLQLVWRYVPMVWPHLVWDQLLMYVIRALRPAGLFLSLLLRLPSLQLLVQAVPCARNGKGFDGPGLQVLCCSGRLCCPDRCGLFLASTSTYLC
jgi:hypothetical protein